MKFSEIAAASTNAHVAVVSAQEVLTTAQAAEAPARSAVVTALKSQAPPTAALVDPTGTVSVFNLTPDGSDFTIQKVAGDFDVPEAPPADPIDEPGPVS